MAKIKWGKFLISSEFLTSFPKTKGGENLLIWFVLPAVSHGISPPDCDTQWCHAPGRPLPLSWHLIMFGMALVLFMDVGTSVMWQLIPFTSHPSNVVSTRYSVTALFPRQVTGNSHSFGLFLFIELDWALCILEILFAVRFDLLRHFNLCSRWMKQIKSRFNPDSPLLTTGGEIWPANFVNTRLTGNKTRLQIHS